MIRQPLRLPLLIPLIGALCTTPASAADRALLVGVGEFRDAPALALQGIDIDLQTMRTVAQQLGYAPEQTMVLHDADATHDTVTAALRDWLTAGVGPEDRVLLYFSTHGTQVADTSGDEDDGADEALLLHDVQITTASDGTETLDNLLLDDALQGALAAIPSRQVLVVVDACHSGSATRSIRLRSARSGSSDVQVKSYVYPGMPEGNGRGLARIASTGVNYVALSAAGDDERSVATPRGSLFTRALAQSIDARLPIHSPPTPSEIKDEAGRWILDALGEADRHRAFHPRLSGNPTLFDKPLRLASGVNAHPPLWDTARQVAARMTPLAARTNRADFLEGEHLELSIDAPRDGYLNILGIDPAGQAVVIFPNAFHRDNRVAAGSITIPGNRAFDLPAGKPFGATLLVAYFTDRPVDLFAASQESGGVAGSFEKVFPPLARGAMRNFIPTGRAQPDGAGAALEVRICPAAGCL